jgi:hypothetical protein
MLCFRHVTQLTRYHTKLKHQLVGSGEWGETLVSQMNLEVRIT